MIEQWQELKETITELRDNDGTSTQQEVCKFLVNYMEVLEKQMVEPQESEGGMTVKDLIKRLLDCPLDYDVSVAVDYSAEKQKETGCKGARFDIISIDRVFQSVQIKVDDWRERRET